MTNKIATRLSLVFGLGLIAGALIIGPCAGCSMDVNVHIDDAATGAVENAAASGIKLAGSIEDGTEKVTEEAARLRHSMDRLGGKVDDLEERFRRMEKKFDRMFPIQGDNDD